MKNFAIEAFLEEDKASEDVTTQSVLRFLKEDPILQFTLLAKQPGVFSGKRWLESFAQGQTPYIEWQEIFREGDAFTAPKVLAKGSAKASAVLAVERTLLNGLQLLCGVATLSDMYVQRVREISQKRNIPAPAVLHTRKILPGLRDYIADALSSGGAGRHRLTLADRILFKDNHRELLKTQENLKAYLAQLSKEELASALFEADSEELLKIYIEAGVKHVMLDNFSKSSLEKILSSIPKNLIIEVSGGIHLGNLEDYVLPGIHRISIGAITHKARSVDISLEALSQ
jgi:nicotinate-nucleotide pyrophosphorylase (carboxylating)